MHHRKGRNPDAGKLIIYHNPLGSLTFDPSITTSVSTTVIWQTDAGITVTSGTSHSLSYIPTAGPKVCKVKVVGGFRLVTTLNANTDALSGNLKDFRRMTQMQTLYLYSDPLLTGDLSSLSAMIQMQNLYLYSDPLLTGNLSSLSAMTQMQTLSLSSDSLLTGNLSSLSAMIQLQILSLASDPLLAGNLSSLSAMTQMQTLYLYSDPLLTGDLSSLSAMTQMQKLYMYDTAIGPASIASLVSLWDVRLYSMWPTMSAADSVDIVIDSMWSARASYTYATPSMQIGGTNQSPTGNYVAPIEGADWHEDAPGHWTPLTPKAKIYDLLNDVNGEGFNIWAITYTA